jgi:hypothetical protein
MMARVVISVIKIEEKWRVELCDTQIWVKREKRRCEHDQMQ